ncbi:MAG: cell wall-active antibiotics response protein, partial [Bacteroidales bacterium]|nr:cell wall-active antibiotics response protein [Bacteroidales bacterium]
KRYLFRWEVLLIGIGILSLFSNQKKGFGIILIAVGGAFYIRDYYELDYNFWQLFWPTMLIIIGFVIIFHHHRPRRHLHKVSQTSSDFLDEVSIFGSSERVINSDSFQGGRLTCIFGGQKLIFTKTKMAPGRNEIEVFALFGGFEIVVPDNWKVKINITPIFGGFSDKKMFYSNNTEPENELIISGTVIFGGGEIKSF